MSTTTIWTLALWWQTTSETSVSERITTPNSNKG